MTTAAQFMSAGPAPLNSNSPWGSRYAAELRRVIAEQADRAPRSRQAHIGPSELGAECSRQVVWKMAGVPRTNHVVDPWPAIVGTAVHAWMAEAFTAANAGGVRWVTEQRVTPHPDYPGTADLYDAQTASVVDWKALGPTSMAKVRSGNVPQHYVVQLLLYGRGYRLMGLPVQRVVIAALPRTASTLDGMYVWEREHTPADDEMLKEVFAQTADRAAAAELVRSSALSIMDVPPTPGENCYFCAAYRPQSARDGGPGCPGTVHSPQSTADRV